MVGNIVHRNTYGDDCLQPEHLLTLPAGKDTLFNLDDLLSHSVLLLSLRKAARVGARRYNEQFQ